MDYLDTPKTTYLGGLVDILASNTPKVYPYESQTYLSVQDLTHRTGINPKDKAAIMEEACGLLLRESTMSMI